MSKGPADRRIITVRILAFFCAMLAIMCAVLAWTWTREREETACWRAVAMYQLSPDGACDGD